MTNAQRTPRFLVVDDQTPICNLMANFLQRLGYEHTETTTLREARTQLLHESFDIAIVDINLAGESGLILLEEFADQSPDLVFIVVSGDPNPESPIEALRLGALGYLPKPLLFTDFQKEVHRVVEKRDTMLHSWMERVTLQEELEGRTRQFLMEVGVNVSLQRSIIQSLCRLTEFRDSETGSHIQRLADYCRELANGLREQPRYRNQIDELFINRLVTTAPLHDIGKAGIPDAILRKEGQLTPQEFELMKNHTIMGRETLEEIKQAAATWSNELITMGQDICAHHHEKWDGTGYPSHLMGEEIPLAARIVGLADFYDALSTARIYRPYSLEHTLIKNMIVERSGTHFDPALVKAFLHQEHQFRRIRENHLIEHPQAVNE